jgi:hypothetical protein
MFRRLTIPALLVAAAIATTGCGRVVINNSSSTTTIGSAPYTEGSGNVATETRPLDAFHAISVDNGMTVFVKRGDAPSVAVTADDNLVSMISTTVENGTLVVTVQGSLTTHSPMRVDVTAAALDSVDQNGGTTVDVEDLSVERLTASVSGGSTLRAGGKVATLLLTAQSGSTADLRNVEAGTVQVSVRAGSTARVNAGDSITGECTTGSTLRVSGSASTAGVSADSGSTVTRE